MRSSAETAQGEALTRFLRGPFSPDRGGEVLAIRPHSATALESFPPERTACLQTNRALADTLEQRGYRIVTDLEGAFSICLVEATKHKDENLYHIALAWSSLSDEGHLIVSAANALGGESLAKRINAAGFPIQSVHSYAKCRVIWISKSDRQRGPDTAEWLALGDCRKIAGTELVACPGVFSAGAVDLGTRLLADALTTPLRGRGADFGAGYGALAHRILGRSDQIQEMELFDIERKALAAAEINLKPWESRVRITYHWADVQNIPPGRPYDWIVMNPPFHAGRAAVPALGKAFIRTAAAHLKSEGSLWLVANRRLPYEAALEECFRAVEICGEREGFKVLAAHRPRRSRT